MSAVARAYEVRAVAVDSLGEGVPYVTYRIYQPGVEKAVAANTGSLDGDVRQTLQSAGEYDMTLSYVGMRDTTLHFTVSAAQPRANLGRVVMCDASEMLEALVVTAQKPLVVKEIDRIGYDVQADPETKTSNLRDILRKVPMVSVEADGTIRVNGSTDFKIYKNGRPNNSMSRNAKDIFAALPASSIKKIEVITEPGATEDAEGTTAILNIVTNDEVDIVGVMGNASVYYDTNNGYPSANLYLQTQIKKFALSGYGGFVPMHGKQQRQESITESYFPETGESRNSHSNTKFEGQFGYFGVESSFDIDTLNLVTAEVSGYAYTAHPTVDTEYSYFDRNGVQTGGFRTWQDGSGTSSYLDMDANVNYQHLTHRKGETYTLSYRLSTTHQTNDGSTQYSNLDGTPYQPYSAIVANYKLNFIEHTFQADYVRPFGNHKVEGGLKWIIRRNHSKTSNDYVDWMSTTSDFSHVTNIGAAYAQYAYKIGPVNLRAGLRYEFSQLKAEFPDGSAEPFKADLNDLVPSGGVSWQINDGNSLTANYSSSINRPGIMYLNPSVTQTPTSVSYGNPDLESARRQSVKLTYMLIGKKVNLNFSANYGWSDTGIAQVQWLTEGNVINSTYANVGINKEVNFGLYFQWSITPKTRWMVNAGADWRQYEQEGYELSHWSPRVYTQLSQTLPWKLNADLGFYYWGGGAYSVYGYSKGSFADRQGLSLSLRRGFLKDDRLNVSVGARNFIGRSRRAYESVTVQGPYTGRNVSYSEPSFAVTLSVSYRFGSINTQVKKTAKTIENDDLMGRKSE